MTRTRSEYRRASGTSVDAPTTDLSAVSPFDVTAEALAVLLLDAYRGTTDDEGEGPEEAAVAIAHSLGTLVPRPSVVLVDDDRRPVAMSFVVVVHDLHYIDPVATASDRKGQGLGAAAVRASLARLADGPAVGAVITDGNTPSERLFARLGFERVGPWG